MTKPSNSRQCRSLPKVMQGVSACRRDSRQETGFQRLTFPLVRHVTPRESLLLTRLSSSICPARPPASLWPDHEFRALWVLLHEHRKPFQWYFFPPNCPFLWRHHFSDTSNRTFMFKATSDSTSKGRRHLTPSWRPPLSLCPSSRPDAHVPGPWPAPEALLQYQGCTVFLNPPSRRWSQRIVWTLL